MVNVYCPFCGKQWSFQVTLESTAPVLYLQLAVRGCQCKALADSLVTNVPVSLLDVAREKVFTALQKIVEGSEF
jgi:hypothetical protein